MLHTRTSVPRPIPISRYPFTPANYPGRRPRFSFFFTSQGIYRCSLRTLRRLLESRGLPPIGKRFAILAYGSNASPGQLMRKYQDHGLTNVPVLYGHLTGAEAVYARRWTNGSYIPATLATMKGSGAGWVTLLAADQFEAMDASEGRPGYYVLAEVPAAQFTIGRSRIRVAPLYGYVNIRGGVMALNGQLVRLRNTGQRRCQSIYNKTTSKAPEECLRFVRIPDMNSPTQFSQVIKP